jgi:hypothetical protein
MFLVPSAKWGLEGIGHFADDRTSRRFGDDASGPVARFAAAWAVVVRELSAASIIVVAGLEFERSWHA